MLLNEVVESTTFGTGLHQSTNRLWFLFYRSTTVVQLSTLRCQNHLDARHQHRLETGKIRRRMRSVHGRLGLRPHSHVMRNIHQHQDSIPTTHLCRKAFARLIPEIDRQHRVATRRHEVSFRPALERPYFARLLRRNRLQQPS